MGKTKAGTVTVIADSGHTGTVKMAGKTAAFAGVTFSFFFPFFLNSYYYTSLGEVSQL